MTARKTLLSLVFLIALGVLISALLVPVHGESHPPTVEKMKILILQLAVILVAAKAGGEICQRFLNQPAVLGELMAGVIIGPYALGGLRLPLINQPLFPGPADGEALALVHGHGIETFPISPELYGVATVAAVLLLFMAGLETDFRQFVRRSLAGTLVGIGGILGAFVVGAWLTVAFEMGGADHFMHPVALFMGTISVATSVGITARVLSEKGKLDTPEGTTILAGAVIDDVLGICILAVVVSLAAAGPRGGAEEAAAATQVDWGEIGLIGYKAIGFWLGVTVVGVLLAARISRVLKFFKGPGADIAVGLALALLIGGLAESVGLAAIIGAYAIGLALSKEPISHRLESGLTRLYQVLVPIFFAVMGMMVDVKAMFGRSEVIIFTLVYTLLAIVGKTIGCALPTFLVGFNKRGAWRIGIGMLPRGEVALIVAGVGLAAGAIPNDLFGVAIAMTLVTTLMAPPILVRLFDEKSGLRKEEEKISLDRIITLQNVDRAMQPYLVSRIREALEEDEFSVSLLNPDLRIHLVTKGDVAMEMREERDAIHFDVPQELPPEVPEMIRRALERTRLSLAGIKMVDRTLTKEDVARTWLRAE